MSKLLYPKFKLEWNEKIKNLTGKTVFITGGASGIGLGMAQAFAEAGAQLVLADIEAAPLEQAEQQFREKGVECLSFIMDISDRDAVKAVTNQVLHAFGRVDIVCANAGVGGRCLSLDEANDDDWDWVIGVNVKGTINTIQALLPALKQNESSHIVITSSISGLRVFNPSRGQGIYNTSKFALVGYAEALAIDLEEYGIGVSVLCPGFVNSQLSFSGRNRPQQFGGEFSPGDDHVLTNAGTGAMDAMDYGRRVVNAVRRNQLFVITHNNERALIEARHERLMLAFDEADNLID